MTVRSHKQFGSVTYADGLLSIGCRLLSSIDTNPRIFDHLWHHCEDERLSSTKIALTTSVRVLGLAISPAVRTVGTKDLSDINKIADY